MEAARWGGSEGLWSETAKHLTNMGIKTIASVQNWQPLSPNIEVLHNQYDIEIMTRNGTSQIIAEETITKQQPNLVVISLGNSLEGTVWTDACRRSKIQYILIVHYAAEWEFPDNSLFEKLKNSYRDAKHIYFVSQNSRSIVEKQIAFGVGGSSSIATCPCNIPLNVNLPFPSLVGGLKMACVARLDPKDKGQDLAISVLAQEKWRKRPIKLSLYGNGSGSKVIQELISYYNLSSVEVVGFVTDIKEIWRNHHVLLLPSRAEGKPLSLMEAMLCGRVPAVTDVAGNTELVTHMETGFVAEFPRMNCVDAMLEHVWQNQSRLQYMGEQAKSHAMALLDPTPANSLAKKLKDFLYELY